MKRIHYGWVICISCTILTMCTMGLVNNGFSVYLAYIIGQNGFTGSQSSSLITVRCLFSLLGMFWITRYYETFTLRVGMTVACLCTACSFFLYAAARSLPLFYLASALAGLSYGFGSMIPVSILITRWFVRRRAFALGICTSGTSLAMLLFPAAIAGVIRRFDLKTSFSLEGAFVLLIGFLVLLLLRNDPSDMGLTPYDADAGQDGATADTKARKAPVLTGGQWRAVYGAFILLGAVAISSSNHLAVLFSSQGYGPMLSALSVSVFGLFLTVSKFLYGLITDRMGGFHANMLFSVFLIAGLFICSISFLHRSLILVLGAGCLGFGFPITTVGIPVIAADFSDGIRFGPVMKRLQICYALGSFLFASLPGVLSDVTGSYAWAYLACTVLYGCFVAVIRHIYALLKRACQTAPEESATL